MREMWVVVTGLLCFVAQGARAQSFEQQVQQISQKLSGAALQTRQAMAASQAATVQGCEGCGAGAVNPADALDETKVGVAAKFVAIKPSEFEMGSPKDEAVRWGDEIQHSVKLTKGYEMQATAVTQLQYFMVMGRNPSTFSKQENCDADNFKVVYGLGLCVNHPVENVSWDDAQAFIAQLNKTQSKYTYRLPTEAEWENAARAGMPSGFPYSFGFNDTNELNNYAWYDGNSNGRTHAVATKKANQCGLYDMNGNVWQWVNDYYDGYPTASVQDPAGPTTGSSRVIRGGSWGSVAGGLRSAFRGIDVPGDRGSRLGFRLVRSSR